MILIHTGGDGGHVQPVLIALTVVTVLLSTVVLTICIIIAFKIYQKYHPNGKTCTATYCMHVEYIIMFFGIGVHAVFELLDRPWQLLKVLQGLKVSCYANIIVVHLAYILIIM